MASYHTKEEDQIIQISSPQERGSKRVQPTVGVIGLGIIGGRVAASLRCAGYPLVVWNRSPRAEPNFLPLVTDIAESADIIQIFVRDGEALLEVLRKLSPALTAKHLILNHATVSPTETLEAANMVMKRGAQFLDAPFTGSRDAAAEGKLVYFVGGSPEVLKKVRSVLEVSSEHIIMLGEIGAATYVKIATNMIMGAQVEILAEALEFLRLGNVPLQRLEEGLRYSVARSGVMGMKLPQMLRGDFEPRFSTKNMLKDLQFALTIVKEHGIDLPATAATAEALKKVVASGLGDADVAALASRYAYPGKEELFTLPETPLAWSSISSQKPVALTPKKSFFSFLKRHQKSS